ncbi:uncharacterized protein LOC128552946, partial [Mercenaria mercenaria]|uniref:uncharacterized protein LOC128552946 n=1 Tax=Mercenaria mercenaria TaxID=6596 RepID=UPI00234F9785
SKDEKSSNGILHPLYKEEKTESRISHAVKFSNEVNTVNIHYHTHATESDNQDSRKYTCKVDLNACEEPLDLLRENGRTKHTETDRVNEQVMKVPKTKSQEVKDSEPACQDDATTPLLRTEPDLDCAKTESPDQRQKLFGTYPDRTDANVLHKTDRGGEPHVTGAGQKTTTGEEFAKGRNELLSQFEVRALGEHMESVGALIHMGEVIGTVFRAGDSYVFTAFHVVRKIIDINLNGQYDFALLEMENVWVNFNASVAEPSCFVYKVCHEFSSNDPCLDFAVLRITNQVQLPRKMFLDKYNFERLQAKMLSGIGYGHPEQHSKCKKGLDPNCQIIFAIKNKIASCREWMQGYFDYYRNAVLQNGEDPALVDNSYVGIDTQRNIFLDITMEHGGSGSPFLTNDGRVVGILTHGYPEFCFKLPLIIRSCFPKHKMFESVLRLDYVYQHISARNPELANNLFGEFVDQD